MMFFLGRVSTFVHRPRPSVKPVDDWAREYYCDDEADEHFDSKEDETEENCKIFPEREPPNQGDVCHGSVSAVVLKNERGSKKKREEWKRAGAFTVNVIGVFTLTIKNT